ncbi:MAG TPA: M1 family metallopeptidase [Acidimicrobiales bacterium]|nr:M1 family metallopeptidase [Acidimicrobiales bacterium]
MTTLRDTRDNPYRLARTVVPSAYRIHLTPDLDAASFTGTIAIEVSVNEPVVSFSLNATELNLSPATVRVGDDVVVSHAPTFNADYETATFTFDGALPVGPATISLDFTGVLNDQLHGFYRSTFVDDTGVSHVIATTQFEATDARRAFPCWDDPAYKATFQVTLVIPEDLAAFSNTREVSSTPTGEGRREVVFAPTMIMSTYLVAFVVGPFEASAPTTVAGTQLRVVYPVGKGNLGAWASEIAVHAIEFFSEYFAIPYPGDKIDLIAVPDFAAGAMENLGCVTFRETELLIDQATASHAEMERVALVVNHELAHMWFGDLVTMDWWEGIWLNEAFATFMESICTDHFRPEWKKWSSFNPYRDMAFTVDGQHSTRPIEFEVVSPDECRGMFDVLTYMKGCAVLRMLEQYLGESIFRDGIREYLARHAYANTMTADLWTALESASGQPVGAIMNTWILQGGFPLLSVNGDTISQEPFMYTEAKGESSIGSNWKVPVLVRSLDGGTTEAHLLEGPSITIEGSGEGIVNAGGWGFYRTAYCSTQLSAIAARLGALDDLERAVLFSDTWASIQLGRLSFVDMFNLAEGLVGMDEPTTWGVVLRAFDMANRIADDAGRDVLARVVQRLCAPVFTRLGWEPVDGESSQAGELRAMIIGALGTYGRDGAVIDEALARFDAGRVSGDLADAIVSITMRQQRPGDVTVCEQRRATASNPQEEQRYLFAPASSGDLGVALDALARAFGEVRTQDAPYLIGALIRDRATGPQIWRAMTERWDEALEKFPIGSPAAMVPGVSTFVGDLELAREVRGFHEAHPLPVGQRQVTQYLDLMDVQIALAQRTSDTLTTSMEAFVASQR